VRSRGPRAHATVRPRLRHRTRRRGSASAVSRPLQACARVVETVCLSAQPPADRSVQRLRRRRRCTAPAHGWAARRRSGPPSARQRARTDAAPCFTSMPVSGDLKLHQYRRFENGHFLLEIQREKMAFSSVFFVSHAMVRSYESLRRDPRQI